MSRVTKDETSKLYLFIEKTIKYNFVNKTLLSQAFTHKSESEINYERLELLGDSIIRLVITHYLYTQYEKASEGILSREIQRIISKDVLAEISLKLGLIHFVKAKNIRLRDNNLKSSISTDLFESMIGAIYIDSNYVTTKKIIIKLLNDYLKIKDRIGEKDPKTLLQEFCQAKKINLPIYKTIKLNKIDHNPRFLVSCELTKYDIKAESSCKNVQVGQKNTSRIILEKLKKNEKNKNSNNRTE